MSMQDPIADMLTRIRNAQAVYEENVSLPSSKLKLAVLKILEDEGYINGYKHSTVDNKSDVTISLKYYQGKPVIKKIKRISKPGLRIYKTKDNLPSVLAGMGIAILTTSQGVMTEKTARSRNLGGELLCTVE